MTFCVCMCIGVCGESSYCIGVCVCQCQCVCVCVCVFDLCFLLLEHFNCVNGHRSILLLLFLLTNTCLKKRVREREMFIKWAEILGCQQRTEMLK